jgi:hypothetical protein
MLFFCFVFVVLGIKIQGLTYARLTPPTPQSIPELHRAPLQLDVIARAMQRQCASNCGYPVSPESPCKSHPRTLASGRLETSSLLISHTHSVPVFANRDHAKAERPKGRGSRECRPISLLGNGNTDSEHVYAVAHSTQSHIIHITHHTDTCPRIPPVLAHCMHLHTRQMTPFYQCCAQTLKIPTLLRTHTHTHTHTALCTSLQSTDHTRLYTHTYNAHAEFPNRIP